jgi:hypothetical protein
MTATPHQHSHPPTQSFDPMNNLMKVLGTVMMVPLAAIANSLWLAFHWYGLLVLAAATLFVGLVACLLYLFMQNRATNAKLDEHIAKSHKRAPRKRRKQNED